MASPTGLARAVRVAVADDHGIVREGVRSMAARAQDVEFVGEASNGTEAAELVARGGVDVLLLDYRLGDENGFDVCRKVKAVSPDTQVLVFTAFGNPELLTQAIRAGASGYILKDTNTHRLPEILRALRDAGTYFDPRLAGQTLLASVGRSQGSDPALGERETAILRLIAQGKSNVEIASELYLSPHTVKFHVTRLLRKYDVRRRSELAGVAHDMFL